MLAPGTRINGKWSKLSLDVVKLLGEGANGAVYLVHTSRGRAAMKVCATAEDAAMEWGLLERAGKLCPHFPTPIAIDDGIEPAGLYFYVMESVPGRPLKDVVPTLGSADARLVLKLTLEGLAALHRTGYAFCDVKPENLLVAITPHLNVRFVDVGGVTAFGRSVRQFTPIYDRGFWGFGNRQADAAYDVAAIALVWLFTNESQPPNLVFQQSVSERQEWLLKVVRRRGDNALCAWLVEALTGQIRDAEDALRRLATVPVETRRVRASALHKPRAHAGASGSVSTAATRPRAGARRSAAKSGRDWSEWLMWLSLGTAAVMAVAAWGQLL
ncbi:protein kinase domain-containing protein [Alicyclobacillus sp. ALC3]|uniref:protein kinase domain-containing protein n=1 Tax=Alicyclobacillus sp. ALC3 TaxID=2796143 RepID=UPI002378FDFB|nr:phosphotransferase [Alicyclobacillus sp. ALC3]WDL98978.1 phosphotransferase [Alicyclobacillus sp. ALC3]